MKCIKNKESGEVRREENHIADRMIKTGEWIFVRKEEWKKYKKDLNKSK